MSERHKFNQDRYLNAFKTIAVQTVQMGGPDLSQRQMAILLTVADQPDYGVKELSRDLNICKPAVSRVLDALSDLGFVERIAHISDGRLVRLNILAPGNAFIENLGRSLGTAMRPVEMGTTILPLHDILD